MISLSGKLYTLSSHKRHLIPTYVYVLLILGKNSKKKHSKFCQKEINNILWLRFKPEYLCKKILLVGNCDIL